MTEPGAKSSKLACTIAAVAIAIVIGLVVLVLNFAAAMNEQLGWQPQDRTRLHIEHMEYARSGIALTVLAPAGVARVLGQRTGFAPWGTHHPPRTFFATRDGANRETIFVPYEFEPGREWLLALRSNDGFWTSESPYFPDAPTMSDEQWQQSIRTARRIEPPR